MVVETSVNVFELFDTVVMKVHEAQKTHGDFENHVIFPNKVRVSPFSGANRPYVPLKTAKYVDPGTGEEIQWNPYGDAVKTERKNHDTFHSRYRDDWRKAPFEPYVSFLFPEYALEFNRRFKNEEGLKRLVTGEVREFVRAPGKGESYEYGGPNPNPLGRYYKILYSLDAMEDGAGDAITDTQREYFKSHRDTIRSLLELEQKLLIKSVIQFGIAADMGMKNEDLVEHMKASWANAETDMQEARYRLNGIDVGERKEEIVAVRRPGPDGKFTFQ